MKKENSETAVGLRLLFRGVKNNLPLIIFGIFFIMAAYIKFWAAPISTGPDVEQFWAFATVYHAYGLDFYRYADAQLEIFPFKGWGFFYPPIWLIILGIVLFLVPASSSAGLMVESTWRLAVKTPIIMADLAIGLLLLWAVPGSKWKKLFFATLWLFHPTAWFESAVFGQFDAIAAAFLLASIIMLIKAKEKLAFLLAGLAVMTKQHTLIAVAMMIIISVRYMTKRRLITNLAVLGGVIAVISIPFLITGNFVSYFRCIVFPGFTPGYQNPLCLSFSGIGAFLTYLHDTLGWNTVNLIPYTVPVMIIVFVVIAILAYKGRVTPLQGMLAGYLIFISFFYRINYQYLVIFIPLAILQAARTNFRSERIYTVALAMLPAVWLWITNIPWWFSNYNPEYSWVTSMFARIGLTERYLSDKVYVCFAVAIMCFSIAYIVLAFTNWRQPEPERDNLQLR